MSSIDTRSPFFLRGNQSTKTESAKGGGQVEAPKTNSAERASEISNKTASDAKVNIPEGVKDFAKIKKAAVSAPEVDNTDKIARLKAQIQAGTYEVDYDGLADKILSSEF